MTLFEKLFGRRQRHGVSRRVTEFHSPCSRYGIVAAGNLVRKPLSETETIAHEAVKQTSEKENDHGY